MYDVIEYEARREEAEARHAKALRLLSTLVEERSLLSAEVEEAEAKLRSSESRRQALDEEAREFVRLREETARIGRRAEELRRASLLERQLWDGRLAAGQAHVDLLRRCLAQLAWCIHMATASESELEQQQAQQQGTVSPLQTGGSATPMPPAPAFSGLMDLLGPEERALARACGLDPAHLPVEWAAEEDDDLPLCYPPPLTIPEPRQRGGVDTMDDSMPRALPPQLARRPRGTASVSRDSAAEEGEDEGLLLGLAERRAGWQQRGLDSTTLSSASTGPPSPPGAATSALGRIPRSDLEAAALFAHRTLVRKCLHRLRGWVEVARAQRALAEARWDVASRRRCLRLWLGLCRRKSAICSAGRRALQLSRAWAGWLAFMQRRAHKLQLELDARRHWRTRRLALSFWGWLRHRRHEAHLRSLVARGTTRHMYWVQRQALRHWRWLAEGRSLLRRVFHTMGRQWELAGDNPWQRHEFALLGRCFGAWRERAALKAQRRRELVAARAAESFQRVQLLLRALRGFQQALQQARERAGRRDLLAAAWGGWRERARERRGASSRIGPRAKLRRLGLPSEAAARRLVLLTACFRGWKALWQQRYGGARALWRRRVLKALWVHLKARRLQTRQLLEPFWQRWRRAWPLKRAFRLWALTVRRLALLRDKERMVALLGRAALLRRSWRAWTRHALGHPDVRASALQVGGGVSSLLTCARVRNGPPLAAGATPPAAARLCGLEERSIPGKGRGRLPPGHTDPQGLGCPRRGWRGVCC